MSITNKKRTMALTLVFVLLVSLFAACGGSTGAPASSAAPAPASSTAPAESSGSEVSSNEPITFDIFINHTWYWTDKYEGIIPETMTERTGVSLNPTRASDEMQLGVMIASGDLPDLVYTDLMLERMSVPELSYSWDELLPEYAPDFEISDIAKEIALSYSSDGKFYTILNAFSTEEEWKAAPAGAPSTASLMYRADILEELGNPPMNTLDEYVAVLEMVKQKYPDMAGLAFDYTFLFNVFKCWFIDGWNQSYFIQNPDSIIYETSAPGYIEFLKYVNKLYRNGYILADNFAYNDGAQATELVINNRAFSYSWYAGNTSDQITGMTRSNGYDNALWLQCEPMVKGAKYYNPGAGWSGVFITKKNKDPGRSIQYLQYMFSEEGQRLSQWGREGIEYTLGSDGIPVYSDEWLAARDDEELYYSKYNPAFYFGISGVTEAVGRAAGASQNALDVMDTIRENLVIVPKCQLLQPLADTDERIIQDQLKEYVKNTEAKVILSQSDDEFQKNYDQMMSDLDKMGVKKLEAFMTAELNS